MSDVPVKSVRKALNLLNILLFEDVQRQGISLSELAARMKMPANSVHNLLKTMAACGYAAHSADGKYIAGPVCAEIGKLNLFAAPASVAIIEKALGELNVTLNEAVVFASLIDGHRVVIRNLNADRAITISQAVLSADNHIYTTPTGRAMTAFADSAALRRILDTHGLPGAQWDGIDGMPALRQALDVIRAKGACVMAPDHRDLAAFGFPVLTRAGELLGAIGCYAPMFRCPVDQHETVLRELSRTAAALGEALSAHRGARGVCGGM
ncbi:MAG: hypothetical protein A3K19_12500 [Lentisphaerae bacterium RIFOXYB12_FULL_65_16]|nr:MAG: hypothetical protein A3K18_12175 [Lentisphaerae bacterium RIFOXYA12_64_32]OGV88103.1 MAG: hypothetical protein A3K19_12500 [Lentisphaerae bacterium RIFOXYB12_FULL_65_16]